eukprot:TRINITY_DN8850_c0_g2_i1.p1 TRINITY_DN8850_c0_g2~~TRINITY_DN8850_c0_g2_i1.p1  ORF type:complete len:768 (+),score=103.33 TRINITY_DN8850_c0_g2_i1:77-2305(+)
MASDLTCPPTEGLVLTAEALAAAFRESLNVVLREEFERFGHQCCADISATLQRVLSPTSAVQDGESPACAGEGHERHYVGRSISETERGTSVQKLRAVAAVQDDLSPEWRHHGHVKAYRVDKKTRAASAHPTGKPDKDRGKAKLRDDDDHDDLRDLFHHGHVKSYRARQELNRSNSETPQISHWPLAVRTDDDKPGACCDNITIKAVDSLPESCCQQCPPVASDTAQDPSRTLSQIDSEVPSQSRGVARLSTTGSTKAQEDDSGDEEVRELFKTAPVNSAAKNFGDAWSMPGRSDSSLSLTPEESTCRDKGKDVIASLYFELGVFLVILVNAALIGVSTDLMARELRNTEPGGFIVIELIFLLIFAIEIILRLVIFGCDFFTGSGWAWNLFDLFVVFVDMTEWLAWRMWQDYNSDTRLTDAFPSMMLLRLARLFRLLRVMRAARFLFSLAIAQDLRTLIDSLRGCLGAFLWTCTLIFTVIYVAAIYFTQMAWHYRLQHLNAASSFITDEIALELEAWYGSLGRSILSLFQALSGGVDWNDIVAPLIAIHPGLGIIFSIYMAFAVLAILNVVTGTFVDTALERAASSKEIRTVNSAKELFDKLDLDKRGSISVVEFQSQLDTPLMSEYLREIDVDPSEASFLFEILDINDSGHIDCDEFLSGCVRLKGPAKALDLLVFVRETRCMFIRMLSERKNIEARLQRIDQALDLTSFSGTASMLIQATEPSSPSTPSKPPTLPGSTDG